MRLMPHPANKLQVSISLIPQGAWWNMGGVSNLSNRLRETGAEGFRYSLPRSIRPAAAFWTHGSAPTPTGLEAVQWRDVPSFSLCWDPSRYTLLRQGTQKRKLLVFWLKQIISPVVFVKGWEGSHWLSWSVSAGNSHSCRASGTHWKYSLVCSWCSLEDRTRMPCWAACLFESVGKHPKCCIPKVRMRRLI